MKVRLMLVKKLIYQNKKKINKNFNFIYFFIEKLFFVLTDLLNFYKLCFIYNLISYKSLINFKNFYLKNYYILSYLDLNFYQNINNIFDLCLYSFNVKCLFFPNKKCLLITNLMLYNFFKIVIIFYKNVYISLNYFLVFINFKIFLKNSIFNYLKNFTILFKFLFYFYEYVKSNS